MERTSTTVKSFTRSADYVGWWIMELDREKDSKILVHNNWVSAYGMLQPGDRVFAEGTALHYSNSDLPCCLVLERAPKVAVEA